MLVTALVSFIMYQLAAFLLPIILAIFLAFVLYPVVNVITKISVGQGTIHPSRVFAIILALIGFCMLLVVAVGLLVLPLFGQINELLVKMPKVLAHAKAANLDIVLSQGNIPQLPSNFSMLFEDILSWSMGFVTDLLRKLLASSMDIVTNLIGLIVVPFMSFYFIRDWRQLREMFINLFNYDAQPRAAHVLDEIGHNISAYIAGLGKLSLIAGFSITVGTMALGVQFPLVLGFLAFLAETIPLVGPMIGAVPAIFIAYGQSSNDALNVAIFYLVFYQIDSHWIMPEIMGEKIDLHPVILIISLLLGAKLFGILGMLFAVPVAAIYRVLYKELWHERGTGVKKDEVQS